MNLRNYLKAAISSLPKMVWSKNNYRQWFVSSRNAPYMGQVNYLDSNVVMAPLWYIMRKEPEAPIVLYDETGEPVKDHEMIRLLKNPNKYYSGTLLRMGIDLSLALDGNAYLVKIRDSQLRVKELWYIPHMLIEPYWEQDSGNYIDYYKYCPDGKEIHLSVDDVIQIRDGIDPNNTRLGMSPLKSALKEVYTDEEAAAFSASILKNAGVPGMIIAPDTDSPISSSDVKETKEYIKTAFSGPRRGEPLVLSGRTQVTKFTFSPSDMDLSGIRNISEERVCSLLCIPAAVVGFGTGVQQTTVGATLTGLRKIAYEDGIMPLQRIFAEEIHVKLLAEFEPDINKYEVGYDYNNVPVLQDDRATKVKAILDSVQGGVLRVDKAQGLLGYDVDDTQAVYLRSMAIMETPAEEKIKPVTEEPKAIAGPGLKAARSNAIAERLVKAFYASELKLRDNFAKQLEARFVKLGKKVAAEYLAQMEEREQKSAIDTIVIDTVLANILTEDNKISLLRFAPQYLQVTKETIGIINDVTGINATLTNDLEFNVIQTGGKRQGLYDLDAQTKTAVYDAITAGREAGEGITAIAKRIESSVASGRWGSAKTRAEVVARTETKYAQNYSSLEVYRESADIGGVLVFDSQLGSFDEYCDAVNGRVVNFDDAAFLRDEEHPNGTRSFSPVMAMDIVYTGLPNVPPNNPNA